MQAHDSKQLALAATPGNWRIYSARKADPKFKAYADKVLQRDRYTCQYCGFQAKIYQEIVNIDGNYKNNKIDNLVTACCFCAQCFFIESVGVGGYGGGTLIYLPELNQTQLNSFCHVLFCAITNDTGYKSTAQSIYRDFRFRAQPVEDKYGEGTSDPSVFGHLLIDLKSVMDTPEQELFQDLRLLPSRAKFRKQIEAWSASALQSGS